MDAARRSRLEQAVRWGWEDVVYDETKYLMGADVEEVKEIVRENAPRYMYTEIGRTMYFEGDTEITPFGVFQE